ncbi:MAG TPA: helix-turn-helix domain-containing protein [Caulobacteraceae bacterium]|jgi:AcrR family transcriptional regulator
MPRNKDALRGRLQQAALELYRERGYEQTTAAEIAARAGVTERTFFRHFADKREVLFDEDPRLRPILTAAVAAAPAGSAPLAVLFHAFASIEPLLQDNRAFTEPRQAVIASTPALRERAEAKSASLTALLAVELQRRGVPEKQALLAARAGMAAFGHAAQSWFENPSVGLRVYLERGFDALGELARRGS